MYLKVVKNCLKCLSQSKKVSLGYNVVSSLHPQGKAETSYIPDLMNYQLWMTNDRASSQTLRFHLWQDFSILMYSNIILFRWWFEKTKSNYNFKTWNSLLWKVCYKKNFEKRENSSKGSLFYYFLYKSLTEKAENE